MTQFRRTVTTVTSTPVRVDGIIIDKGADLEATSSVQWYSVQTTEDFDNSVPLVSVPKDFAAILEALYQKDERDREIERVRALELIAEVEKESED